MPDKIIPGGSLLTRKKYTPAFKAECVRQVAAGARQTDVARAQGLLPALLGRWQRQALAEAVPSSAAIVAENLLLGQPAPTGRPESGVGWRYYVPAPGRRTLVLPGHVARCLLGWHLNTHMPTELVLNALEQALTLRQPAPGLIIHADRGSQYTSSACRTRSAKAHALASFSRPGNPYANAQAEAGWSTLKTELLPHGGAFARFEEARLEVAYYLDTYFNLDRRHSALGYCSPHQFERNFQISLA